MEILPTDFDAQSIRRVFDEDTETWWFSVVDVVQVLTESKSAKRYWSDLKRKLAQEAGSEQPYDEIVQFKLTAADGKQRETDCAKAATLLRIVQSVPSPKAEPIKLWLAKVGYERMQEMADPALSLNRARQIAETTAATGMADNTTSAKAGGGIAKQARKQLERQTGRPVVSGQNYLAPHAARPLKVARKK